MVNCCGHFDLRYELNRSDFEIKDESDKFIKIQITNKTFHSLLLEASMFNKDIKVNNSEIFYASELSKSKINSDVIPKWKEKGLIEIFSETEYTDILKNIQKISNESITGYLLACENQLTSDEIDTILLLKEMM